jgi:hypothetical protein
MCKSLVGVLVIYGDAIGVARIVSAERWHSLVGALGALAKSQWQLANGLLLGCQRAM